jgi:uncharacterized protein (UPF0254 family)
VYLLQTFTTANANKSDHITTVTFMDHQAIKCPALMSQEINTDVVLLMCLFLPSVKSVKWNSKFTVGSNITGQFVPTENICLTSLPLYNAAKC